MTDHKDEESNNEGSEDEGEDKEGMICDGVGNALPLISLKKRAAMQSGGVGDDWLLNRSAATISGGVGNAPLLRQSSYYFWTSCDTTAHSLTMSSSCRNSARMPRGPRTLE